MTYLSPAAKRRLYILPRCARRWLAGADVYRPVRDALRAAGTDDLRWRH